MSLSSPGRLGGLRLGNRTVFPPVLTNFTSDRGEVSERVLDFYRRRAAGGYGLILSEACYVLPQGGVTTRGLALHDERFLPGLRRLADAIHLEGSHLGIQLFVDGAGFNYAPKESVTIGPSDLSRWDGPPMHPLTRGQIRSLVLDFALAASLAVRGGADLIELHMAHGHLLGRFLSPHFNRRDDEYGGTVSNRARFPMEVLRQARAAVGAAVPITCRLSLSERIPGGIEMPEAIAIVKELSAAGLDGVHVSIGAGTDEGRANIFPTSFSPEAPFASSAASLRRATGSPVIFAGKVRTPAKAEELISTGCVDFVSVGRPGLADPDWPRKAMGLDPNPLHPCIGCNQGCVDRLLATKEVSCTVNPWLGLERSSSTLSRLKQGSEYLVVGGGLAGLVLSSALADRGASVTLYEQERILGGQFRWAASVPGKQQYGEYLDYLISKLDSSRILVLTDRCPGPADLGGASQDQVFWAAGAVATPWQLPGLNIPVCAFSEIFDGSHKVGHDRVLVLGAGQIGCDLALWLSAAGCSITLVDRRPEPLTDLGSRRHDYERELHAKRVDLRFGSDVVSGGAAEVHLAGRHGMDVLQPDLIVAAIGRVARPRPPHLEQAVRVGDSLEPRTALEAVRESSFHGSFVN